jgi:hypothetical protein
MPILATGTTFANNDQVTAATLNQAVNGALFASGAVDGSTTQLSGGAIIVRDGGVTAPKLASSAATTDKIADLAVTTGKIANAAVTAAKLESGTNGQLFIGNGTGFQKATLTAGSNITITNGGGSITIAAASGALSGTTGSTANALLRADGTGGSTVKASSVLIDDSGNIDNVVNLTASGVFNTSSGAYRVGGTQVLGAQQAAEANVAVTSGGSLSGMDTLSEISVVSALNAVENKLNALLAKLRTHGIIAT